MNTIRIASAGGSTALEVNGKVYGPGIEEIEFSQDGLGHPKLTITVDLVDFREAGYTLERFVEVQQERDRRRLAAGAIEPLPKGSKKP